LKELLTRQEVNFSHCSSGRVVVTANKLGKTSIQ